MRKLVGFDLLERVALEYSKHQVVATNGCFDILHVGHVLYLEHARSQGDLLVVGVNGDNSVVSLKGPGRPINSESQRAAVVAGLESVNLVTVFPQVRADEFLRRLRPKVWVKAGDYSLETIDQGERAVLESIGCKIVFAPFIAGTSTTKILGRLTEQQGASLESCGLG